MLGLSSSGQASVLRGQLGKQAESLHADLQGGAEVSEVVLGADADMAIDALASRQRVMLNRWLDSATAVAQPGVSLASVDRECPSVWVEHPDRSESSTDGILQDLRHPRGSRRDDQEERDPAPLRVAGLPL